MIDKDRKAVGLTLALDESQSVAPLKVEPTTNRLKIKIMSAPGAGLPPIQFAKDANRNYCAMALNSELTSVLKTDENGYLKVKFI